MVNNKILIFSCVCVCVYIDMSYRSRKFGSVQHWILSHYDDREPDLELVFKLGFIGSMIGVRGGRFEDIEENVYGVPERIEYARGYSYNCKLEKQIHTKGILFSPWSHKYDVSAKTEQIWIESENYSKWLNSYYEEEKLFHLLSCFVVIVSLVDFVCFVYIRGNQFPGEVIQLSEYIERGANLWVCNWL